jgi:hypothetical protein
MPSERTFGPESVFMDTEAIRVSADWREAIYRGLQQSSHVTVVTGPRWLRVTGDTYAAASLDDDWMCS